MAVTAPLNPITIRRTFMICKKKTEEKKTKTSEILRKHTNIDFPDSDNPKLFCSAVFEVSTVNKSGLTVCYVHNFWKHPKFM